MIGLLFAMLTTATSAPVRYSRLPDWFLAFDVYDRASGQFRQRGLAVVPLLAAGRFDLPDLRVLLGGSKVGNVHVRRDVGMRLVARAKLVRSEIVQTIGERWSKRALAVNALAEGAARE